MEQGNVHGAIKIITNNMAGGVLPINEKTIELLREKHPVDKDANEASILQGPYREINPIVYESIDESTVMCAVLNTKGGSGPSGMDANGWRKPLTSKVYGESGSDLRSAIANTVKKCAQCRSKTIASKDSTHAGLYR